MSAPTIYLLKVSLGIALLVIPYYLFLRKDPLLVTKRLYLAGGILLSWVFPLLMVSKPGIVENINPAYIIDPGIQAAPSEISAAQVGSGFPYWILPLILYLSGILFLVFRGLFKYVKMKKLRSEIDSGQKDVVISKGEQVFTLFPTIYLPEKYASEKDIDSILIHERAHISQFHFIDLLLSEITLLLTWFNPFSWLISRMIKENHEHLADRHVLQQGIHPAHYKALLLNHAMGGQVFRMGHQFNHSLTKKRFEMMKKIKAKRKGFIKYLLFVPFILAFMLVVTANAQGPKTITGNVYLESNEIPATGAAVIVAGTTQGTVVNMDGEFKLEIDGNPELVFSFVGYETKRLKAKTASSKPVILLPKAYTYDYDNTKEAKPPKVVNPDKLKKDYLNGVEGASPVYVVDGKKVEALDNLLPEDIEKIEVIKDAKDPTALKYGATDGIILITSKDKGKQPVKVKEGKPQETFYIVEEMPSFPGGKPAMRDYILENLEYPEKAKKNNISGKVVVQFIVTPKGTLKNIEAAQSTNEMLNDAAMDVFRDMPLWNPGRQRGKPLNVKVLVPVTFVADKE